MRTCRKSWRKNLAQPVKEADHCKTSRAAGTWPGAYTCAGPSPCMCHLFKHHNEVLLTNRCYEQIPSYVDRDSQ